MNSRLIESIYRRLIIESAIPDIEGLAACAEYDESEGYAVLFRIDEESIKWIKSAAMGKISGRLLGINGIVVGMISITEAAYPCWGASEVSQSVGPDFGKIVYGMGYAMSPHGRLMSDRSEVSKSAMAGWSRAALSRKALKFDNVSKPKTKPEEDDCSVYRGAKGKILNVALESQGWEKAMLDKLVSAGEPILAEALKEAEEAGKQTSMANLVWALKQGADSLYSGE